MLAQIGQWFSCENTWPKSAGGGVHHMDLYRNFNVELKEAAAFEGARDETITLASWWNKTGYNAIGSAHASLTIPFRKAPNIQVTNFMLCSVYEQRCT